MLNTTVPALLNPSVKQSSTQNHTYPTRDKEQNKSEFNEALTREVSEITKNSESTTPNNETDKSEASTEQTLTEQSSDNAITNTALQSSNTPENSNQAALNEVPLSPTPQHPLLVDTIHSLVEDTHSGIDIASLPMAVTVPTTPPSQAPSITHRLSPTTQYGLYSQPQQDALQNMALSNNHLQSFDAADFAVDGKNSAFDTLFNADFNKPSLGNIEDSTSPLSTHSSPLNQTGTNGSQLTTSTATTPQSMQLDTQVGQGKWGNDLAQKVVWLSNQQNQMAEIRLNPAHLGPVEVMLNITSGELATAQFSSPHAAVREAIESALPRLREMMAENGIELGNVMVGADSFQQQEQSHQHAHSSSSNEQDIIDGTDGAVEMGTSRISTNSHQGLVNTFA